jgi:tetracycline 7-halogenase / FADH2 O2-dependent halogenase
MESQVYDVAIVGGGIGGSALAAILARHGVSVLLLEGGAHPRFAIGESTIPETTLLLRILASRYQVPELAYLSTYGGTLRNISSGCGVKRNFSFFQHSENEPADPARSTQLPTFAPPLGPDCHLFRQDVDAWLYYLALRYGATGIMNAQVTEIDIGGTQVDLRTRDGRLHRARFVVDAGGIRALLPQVLGLRETPCPYRTRTRSIFTHMVGVLPWEMVADRAAHGLPSPPSQGTLHHVFDGGWAWIIPFDNHPRSTNPLCSVGINLALDKFPGTGAPPQEEFWSIVARFPSLARQLRDARPARGFMGSQANQFSSKQLAGDRWFLLPHASNFIDPLFSSGLSVTFWAVNQLAARLLDSVRTDQFSAERFEPVTDWVTKCFDYYDGLVSRSYTSFADFDLWNAWSRMWVLGSLYGNNGLIGVLSRARGGLDDPAWAALEAEPYRGVQALDNTHYTTLIAAASAEIDRYAAGEQPARDACARIYQHLSASELCPAPLGLLDPAQRCPAGTFTLLPLARLMRWGARAPDHVRGRYFADGTALVSGLLIDDFKRETRSGVTAVPRLVRDTFTGWNKDWSHLQWTPR